MQTSIRLDLSKKIKIFNYGRRISSHIFGAYLREIGCAKLEAKNWKMPIIMSPCATFKFAKVPL